MNTTVTLDESHFKLLTERARALGTTPEEYLKTLIDAGGLSFDEILGPIREGFESVGDDELGALLERAQLSARQQK